MATTPNFSVNSQVQTGNRVAILLGGMQIGAMQSVRMSKDFGLDAVYGIGDAEPVEHVPTAARYSLSCTNVVLRKGSMQKAGLTSINATDALKGLVFDIEVYSKDSGELLQKYQGCSFASGDASVDRNAIVMASAQFMALTVSGSGF